ncbi:MAG: protein kinase domain-containing protein, partial [Gammaproteobacteria bacterium]
MPGSPKTKQTTVPSRAGNISSKAAMLASAPTEIIFDPLVLDPNDKKQQAILRALLAKMQKEGETKLKRTSKINSIDNKNREQHAIRLLVNGQQTPYLVTLTNSIVMSTFAGEKVFYVLTHSTKDAGKYLVAQDTIEQHKQKRPDKTYANCTVIRIKHKIELENGKYRCIELQHRASNILQQPVAIKLIQAESIDDKYVSETYLKQEREILAAVEKQRGKITVHDEVITRDSGEAEKDLLLMGLYEGLNGVGWLNATNQIDITTDATLDFILSILDEAILINNAGFVHRDYKMDNFIIKDERKVIQKNGKSISIIVKVTATAIDVGAACKIGCSSNDYVSTKNYLPPEILDYVEYDEKQDVFSLSATIAILALRAEQDKVFKYRHKSELEGAIKQKFDFSSIKYPGNNNIKHLLQLLLLHMSVSKATDRPTLIWCRSLVLALRKYENADANDKKAMLCELIKLTKNSTWMFKRICKKSYLFDSDFRTVILENMKEQQRLDLIINGIKLISDKKVKKIAEIKAIIIQAAVTLNAYSWKDLIAFIKKEGQTHTLYQIMSESWDKLSEQEKFKLQAIMIGLDSEEVLKIATASYANDEWLLAMYRYLQVNIDILFKNAQKPDGKLIKIFSNFSNSITEDKITCELTERDKQNIVAYFTAFYELGKNIVTNDVMMAKANEFAKLFRQCEQAPFLYQVVLALLNEKDSHLSPTDQTWQLFYKKAQVILDIKSDLHVVIRT